MQKEPLKAFNKTKITQVRNRRLTGKNQLVTLIYREICSYSLKKAMQCFTKNYHCLCWQIWHLSFCLQTVKENQVSSTEADKEYHLFRPKDLIACLQQPLDIFQPLERTFNNSPLWDNLSLSLSLPKNLQTLKVKISLHRL